MEALYAPMLKNLAYSWSKRKLNKFSDNSAVYSKIKKKKKKMKVSNSVKMHPKAKSKFSNLMLFLHLAWTSFLKVHLQVP